MVMPEDHSSSGASAHAAPSSPPQPPNVRADGVAPAPTYRGRVRTGCLTCRKRKVKCDEQRPSCRNCCKARRSCMFPARKCRKNVAKVAGDPIREQDAPAERDTQPSNDTAVQVESQSTSASHPSSNVTSTPFLTTEHHNPGSNISGDKLHPSIIALMTSQDISICTTIDLESARRVNDAPSFSSFISDVNLPVIAIYDPLNWARIKSLCVNFATFNKVIRAATLAVQALYSAQMTGLPISHALTLYRTASDDFNFNVLRSSEEWDFDTVLIIAFLLGLCEVLVPAETQSVLSMSSGPFVERLESAAIGGYFSPVALRISEWLKVMQPASRRSGNSGILSDVVRALLPSGVVELPSLSLLDMDMPSPSQDLLFDTLSTPVFSFYRELQDISSEVASLSHYHRSRTTGHDQVEVDELMAQLKTRLYILWQRRPGPMRLGPSTMRNQLAPAVAEPLIELVGATTAEYHAEIVEIGRTLSEPPLASPEAKESIRKIRNIIEDTSWNAYGPSFKTTPSSETVLALPRRKLNPGYLRPVFMCAIESVNEADTRWGIDRIREISNNICRSEFFALFAESLAKAQRSKGRRVTTRWFCCETFGVPPPYL